MFKVISVTDHEKMLKITRIDADMSNIGYTLWDAVLRRDFSMLSRVNRNLGFTYTPSSNTYPMLRAAGYLSINFVLKELTDITARINPTYKEIACARVSDYVEPVTTTADMRYVFSDAFYTHTLQTQAPFEQLLYSYLKEEVLDTNLLCKLLDQYQMWPTKEQFYLIPILIILVKDAISRAYKSI